jgi:hypothetical protein
LIKRQAAKQEQPEFMQQHPIIRNIGVYGELVRTSLRQPPPQWQRRELRNHPLTSNPSNLPVVAW